MKYLSVITACEPRIIGVRNGVMQAEIQRAHFANKDRFDALEKFLSPEAYLLRTEQAPPVAFEVEYAALLPRAKLTDFMSFGPFLMACPFLISGRAKDVLLSHNMPPCDTFKVQLYRDREAVDAEYYLLYCPLLGYEVVDFAHSQIRITSTQFAKYKLDSWEAYKRLNEGPKGPVAVWSEVRHLALNDTFNQELDFFSCRPGGEFVSERLQKALKKARLTGLEIGLHTSQPTGTR